MALEASSDRPEIRRLWIAVAAGTTGLVVDAIYIGIILAEGDAEAGRVGTFAILVAAYSLVAIGAGLAARLPERTRLVMLAAAAGGLLTAGVLGIFSIGLPLLVAGILCCSAWMSVARRANPVPDGSPILSALAAIGAGALLVLGIALT